MHTEPRLTGDAYYMELARTAARRSRDPTTRVGAVVVKDDSVLGTGYNGFPPGIPDEPELLNDRRTKLTYTIHAEINAMARAGGRPACRGATIYVSALWPCTNCALVLLAHGIVRVVYEQPTAERAARWADDLTAVRILLKTADVELVEFGADPLIVFDKIGPWWGRR